MNMKCWVYAMVVSLSIYWLTLENTYSSLEYCILTNTSLRKNLLCNLKKTFGLWVCILVKII